MMTDFNDDENNFSQDDQQADSHRNQHAIENRLAILESDLRKFLAQKESLEMQIRKQKKAIDRMKMDLSDKRKQLDDVDFKAQRTDDEIKKLKKQLNFSFLNKK